MPLEASGGTPRLGTLLAAIFVAGLLAGLLAAGFHAIATEPIIDQAIQLEEMRHADAAESEPVVPRNVQKIGLFVGWLILGFVYAALLGVSYVVARGRGWIGPGISGPLFLAAGAYLAIALFPALKYPANPPGVGDPETIGFRQGAFLASWVLALGGAMLIGFLAGRLQTSLLGKTAVAAASLALWLVVLYALLPPNPDPVTMPLELISGFRVRSLEGLTVFWLVLACTFAVFSGKLVRRRGHTG